MSHLPRRARLAVLAALAIAGGACDRDHGQPATPAASSSVAATAAPSAPLGGRSCEALVEQFDVVVARGGACASDADCACYPGGISSKHGCGGITDVVTAKRLDAIQADYGRATCRSGIACAAWACAPICEAGRCANGPRRK